MEAVSSHRVGGGGHKSLTRAAGDPQLLARFAAVMSDWCSTVEAALRGAELAAGKDAEDAGGWLCGLAVLRGCPEGWFGDASSDAARLCGLLSCYAHTTPGVASNMVPCLLPAGPEVELAHWRSRMLLLTSLGEQLQGPEHRAVAAVCTAAAVPACARWRELEVRLADAAAEAAERQSSIWEPWRAA